jgi:uncharacterized protein (DUF2141 family)
MKALVAALVFMAGVSAGRSSQAEPAARGTLVVELTGFRNDQGQLLLRLFDSERGYPKDAARAVRQLKQRIEGGRVLLSLADLPFGAYAIGCVHDENGDGTLNTNLLGIPKEGVCASNDASGHRGPPAWKDARFEFTPNAATIHIHVRY